MGKRIFSCTLYLDFSKDYVSKITLFYPCSDYSLDSLAHEILNAGVQSFMQKPFAIATLSDKLREVLESA